MKKLFTSILLATLCVVASANQFLTPKGLVEGNGKVNTVTGKAALQQDMISNAQTDQPFRRMGFVTGRRSNMDNTRCDLWEGPTCQYVFPAAAQRMQFVSTSASDAAAGTGVRTVHVHYLDANYNPGEETVTMNGLTPALTVATNIFRINRVISYTVGSNNAAVGTVSLQNTAGTVTYSLILPNFTASRQVIYTVPAGKTGYVSHWQASSGAATGSHFTTVSARSTAFNEFSHPGIFASFDEVGSLNSAAIMTLPIPVRIPEKTDVKMSAVSDAANAGVTVLGTVMGWFEDN